MKKTIPYIIYTSVFLLCASIVFFICFDDLDACLDSGVCKEGLSLKMNDGNTIIINKTTCEKYKGVWRSERNDCLFKN